jgi:putative N6-adenine-specific DNA methylase
LGAQDIQPGVRSVSFVGDKGFMYKANFCLRTAIRILKPFATFKVRNEKELYQKLYDINWLEYMTADQTLAVDSVVNSPQFTNSHYIQLRTKDAIVDRIKNDVGSRPDVDKDNPDLRIHIHINRENVALSLDSSGQPLFKRGYRSAMVKAPMNEVLAAGLILLSEWDGRSHLVDPMCGSGTILIEAALIALNIPPQIRRESFGFMTWSDFDADLFEMIKSSREKLIRDTTYTFTGYDTHYGAIKAAKESVQNAALEEFISIYQKDFFNSHPPDGPTWVIFNPPYGERLPLKEDFYKKIGDTLKQQYAGATAWIITSDMNELKKVGLKTSRRINIRNAALDCKFVRYDLYAGTRKVKGQQNENQAVGD